MAIKPLVTRGTNKAWEVYYHANWQKPRIGPGEPPTTALQLVIRDRPFDVVRFDDGIVRIRFYGPDIRSKGKLVDIGHKFDQTAAQKIIDAWAAEKPCPVEK